MSAGLLTASAIAAKRGWSRQYAHRWLRILESKHGAKLVRQGKRVYISREELLRASVNLSSRWTERAVEDLRERVDSLEGLVSRVARQLAEMRRASDT